MFLCSLLFALCSLLFVLCMFFLLIHLHLPAFYVSLLSVVQCPTSARTHSATNVPLQYNMQYLNVLLAF